MLHGSHRPRDETFQELFAALATTKFVCGACQGQMLVGFALA